ncbi:MAG: TetR/AcrR family transcriptional regulator [Terracidiphilus sp.]
MTELIVNKNQLRTQETLEKLLAAAEEVFVRDGYDGAQLAEIAATAGRSKGALYGHFKSKEDLFLALFEYRTQDYVNKFRQKVENCRSRQQRLKAFREFYVELVEDKTWPILTLEFKLYSLRHPESKQHMQKSLEQILPTSDEVLFVQMFGNLVAEKRTNVDLALLALGPLLSGLILESNFYPQQLYDRAIQQILGKLFDALFPHQR